jgi:para-nitrobenzyl esterase
MRRLGLLAVLLACGAGARAQNVAAVKIDTGALRGVAADGVVSWKGIPYAAPPVGALRWRDPQPAAKWTGVRDAAQYGSDCLQAGKVQAANTSEDCLYVNVWRPEKMTAKTPVMVWIHGGGFVSGGSSTKPFDGTEFAKHGVVLVTLNYRLGRFGFFSFPALTAEGNDAVLNNYGLMDQVAALQWVQRNISSFGGDPKRVTVFGESAGGISVQLLMASTMTKGLFSQAIVESGAGKTLHGIVTRFGIADGEKTGLAFAHKVGIEGTDAAALEKLRALPADTLKGDLTMSTSFEQGSTFSDVVADGKLVTVPPDEVFGAGGGAKVPLMIGATNEDVGGKYLASMTDDALWNLFGANADEAKAAFASVAKDSRRMRLELGADAAMIEPARYGARAYAAKGVPVYEYRWSYVPVAMRSMMTGAKHASELAFVFDNLPQRKELTDADKAMAAAINGYWAAFGRTGNPNGEGRPEWPRYEAKTDVLMNFTDDGPKAMADPVKEQLDVVDKLVLPK